MNNIPEKEERIIICKNHTCDNCPLSNVWCFEDVDLQPSLFDENILNGDF